MTPRSRRPHTFPSCHAGTSQRGSRPAPRTPAGGRDRQGLPRRPPRGGCPRRVGLPRSADEGREELEGEEQRHRPEDEPRPGAGDPFAEFPAGLPGDAGHQGRHHDDHERQEDDAASQRRHRPLEGADLRELLLVEIDGASLGEAAGDRLREFHAPRRVLPASRAHPVPGPIGLPAGVEVVEDRRGTVELPRLRSVGVTPSPAGRPAGGVRGVDLERRPPVRRHRGDRKRRSAGPGGLPASRRMPRGGESDGQRGPGRLPVGGTERRQPGRRADEHAHQIGVAAELPLDRVARAVGEAALEDDRLHRSGPVGDPPPQPPDRRTEPLRQDRHQPGARIPADHVELPGEEHGEIERLHEQQGASGLDELPHGVGPPLVPSAGGDRDGVAGIGVEKILPRHTPGAGRERGVGGDVGHRTDPVPGPGRGPGERGGGVVETEQAEVHRYNCSRSRGK